MEKGRRKRRGRIELKKKGMEWRETKKGREGGERMLERKETRGKRWRRWSGERKRVSREGKGEREEKGE